MKNKAFSFLSFFLMGPLFGGPPRESLSIQEFRLSLDEMNYKLNHHKTEIDLFHERIQSLEKTIEDLRGELKTSKVDRSSDKRLAAIEKAQEALAADLKTLKNHLTETNSSIATTQSKLASIDEQITSDIRSLKQSLQNMLSLLQKDEGSKNYVVKPGDSLGQIALENRTDIKTIKRLNNLSSDVIVVGQKLILP